MTFLDLPTAHPASDPLTVAVQGVRWLTIAAGLAVADYHTAGEIDLLWTWWRNGHLSINPLIRAGGWLSDKPQAVMQEALLS